MKSHWTLLGALVVLVSILALAEDPPKPAGAGALTTLRDRASYAIGVNIGTNMKAQGVDIDPQLLARGMQDVFAGAAPLLTKQELAQVMQEFQADMQSKAGDRKKAAGEKNRAEGAKFLAENAKKQGVVTLPSGLQYKVIKEGSGPKPKATDTVKTHYRGTLTDGTEFDSSIARGEPASFPVNGVIKGWTEALQLMPVGSKWELCIPSELAYGPSGQGPVIGPNAVLVFEVELLEVKQ